jgi:hypothetical protein
MPATVETGVRECARIASQSTALVRSPDAPEPRAAEARRAHSHEDEALFEKLRDIGIQRVSGPFPRHAWRRTCDLAGLFRFPLRAEGTVRADLRRVNDAAAEIEAKQTAWWRSLWVDSPVAQAVQALRASGELLPSMFPRFEEDEHGHPVTIRFPVPPRLTLEVILRASLAGVAIHVAVPAEAIRIGGVERAAIAADPIVFGVVSRGKIGRAAHDEDGGKVLVFDHYGADEGDPEAVKTLVAVLDSMTVKL